MWDLPGPGLEPVSPALAGGFLTTAPPWKYLFIHSCCLILSSWWINYNLFVHSTGDVHLGSLDFLDIMNNGAVNICVRFVGYPNFCWIYCQGVELQGHKVCICSFSKMVIPVYSPTSSSVCMSQLLSVLTNTCYCLLNFSHSGRFVALSCF